MDTTLAGSKGNRDSEPKTHCVNCGKRPLGGDYTRTDGQKAGKMKRALKMAAKATIYHYAGGQRAEGPPDGVTGDLSGVSGNLTGVTGNLTGVWGYLSGVSGDLSGVWGDLTGVSGDLSGVRGDLTGVRGDLGGVSGNLTGVSGYLSGVSGNLTGVSGNFDDCEITPSERAAGVNVRDLIAE